MSRFRPVALAGWCSLLIVAFTLAAADRTSPPDHEQRAIAYLSQEVPDWPRQNNCFSCHNNGDAARALYVAASMSHQLSSDVLSETTAWLLQPLAWDDAKGDPGFSDLKLARIQFAAALTEAFQTGFTRDRTALLIAAERIVDDQEDDGFWDVDVPGVVGSPATYGDTLGTYMARRILETADAARFADAITRADNWFLSAESAATVDVAALTLALADRLRAVDRFPAQKESAAAATNRLRQTVEDMLANRNGNGGWGPYPKSPSEPFDTALALLALKAAGDLGSFDRKSVQAAVERGRTYLISTQLPVGGWPETTRPSGFQSYAQHISTSGWAALALLKTRDDSQ